jgi:hypothetical protein
MLMFLLSYRAQMTKDSEVNDSKYTEFNLLFNTFMNVIWTSYVAFAGPNGIVVSKA